VLDKEECASIIFIDFSSAYDTVDRFKLIKEVEKLGFWNKQIKRNEE